VLVNNFADVMSSRSQPKRIGDTVDAKIAALFANMKPGAVMVTLAPIDDLGATNTEVLEERRKQGLVTPAASKLNASFFEMEELDLGPTNKCVSWSQDGGKTDPLKVYKYTRLSQSDDSRKPVTLCAKRHCKWAKDATTIPATKTLDNGALVMNWNGCLCRGSFRKTRDRASCKKPVRHSDCVAPDKSDGRR
jgi:hypothetical protein